MPASEESTAEIMDRLHTVPDVEEDDWLALGAALKQAEQDRAQVGVLQEKVAAALATLRGAQSTQPARGHLLDTINVVIAQLGGP